MPGTVYYRAHNIKWDDAITTRGPLPDTAVVELFDFNGIIFGRPYVWDAKEDAADWLRLITGFLPRSFDIAELNSDELWLHERLNSIRHEVGAPIYGKGSLDFCSKPGKCSIFETIGDAGETENLCERGTVIELIEWASAFEAGIIYARVQEPDQRP